ncbi:MAG TPA: stage V sporulation protein AC [Syntrophomonas sp.]|nr:stage V sporulation protein AC [Syntrophomonas sp.]
MFEEKSEELKALEKQEYQNLVEQVKPKPPLLSHCIWAFAVGGLICVIAQVFNNYLMFKGMDKTSAGSAVSVIMIFLGALLTGLGLYDKIGEKAGAGSIVPITGFSNVIVASAMEFKREGYIFGVGAKIFSIAGPTLLFGFTASVLIGLIAYCFK